MMPAPAITAERLSKVYRLYEKPSDRLKQMLVGRFGRHYGRDFWALTDVSFTVAPGDRLGLIGPNGSGKSTLLQILAGTLAPSAGRAEIAGRVAALLELGSGFNPDYTGRENIYMNAAIQGLTRAQIDDRFDEIAAFADIGAFLDQPVKTYSSGMFMRVAFAVTTTVDADVLLIDEALAVGDVFFTQKCFRRLHALLERGVAVVLVSHDMAAVSQFCNNVVLLEHGRVAFNGDTTMGIRSYFALERTRTAVAIPVPSDNALAGRVTEERNIPDWPADPMAFLPISEQKGIGTGARCTALALCDDTAVARQVFEMGQTAIVFVEYELNEDVAVPVGGIEIVNERNIVVHGKNAVQYRIDLPLSAERGSRIRIRHRIALDVAEGRYAIGVGLSTIAAADYHAVEDLPYPSLAGRIRTLLNIPGVAAFSVTQRRTGQGLPFHGLCDLDGDIQMVLLPAPAAATAETRHSSATS